MCTYIKNSVNPCETCPRLISALHKCKLLQETIKSNQDGRVKI